MEIRRRKKKDEKNKALEQQIENVKRNMKEAEDWQHKKNFLEKMVPFCVGLAMLFAGAVYYMRS